MKYNKEKHLYLLKHSQKLESEGKHIYDESEKDFFALREYSAMLINHLHWENRQQYFELIEQLLNGPVEFLKLRKKHRSVNDAGKRLQVELILLEPNEKCEGFDDLIDELVSLFDRYCPDPSLRESHEFSEEELKKLIQKIFIEMKDRYP
jgi:hypothetical protein